MNAVTGWIDGRIMVFGKAFADRIVELCKLQDIGDTFGDWLLGLNEQLQREMHDGET